jgi:hypothetical protein
MKKLILSLLVIVTISLSSFGQAPEAFKYQAVIRDGSSLILTNQLVGMQLMIRQGSAGGTPVYTETFTPTTNGYGLVNLEIGTGTTSDDFTIIDWANGPYFIETAVDITGGVAYLVMGTSQLMSVPYALHAKTADNVLNDAVDDADSDPANELQIMNMSNDTLYLSNGGSVYLGAYGIDNVIDADADPNNEIQDLQLLGNILTITNNGAATSIDLSSYLDNTDTQLDSTAIANMGFIASSGTCGLEIGDWHAGGIIFYLDGTGCSGLVAAPTDLSTGAQWGCVGSLIAGADGTAIGTGYQNTIDIEAGCFTSGTAADICANHTDWFLPSRDELNLMYQNIGQGNALGLGNVGGFANFFYWSSTELDAFLANGQDYNTGSQFATNKDFSGANVRAIRAF